MPTQMVFLSPSRQHDNSRSPNRSYSARGSSRSVSRHGNFSGAPNEKVTRIIQGHLMPIRDKNEGNYR
jgi:hypothetical protein